MMKLRRLTTLVFAVLAATPLAGHAQAGDDKGPIVVGAVSSLTGTGASDACTQAAQLVFNAVNAAGGIQGRPIEYRVIDDQMNPAKAQEAADNLVNDLRVVALAGSSSVLECAVNHTRYAQAGLFSLPGAGVDPLCFSATHIAPLNAGPYVSTANALTFASKVLKRQGICVVSPSLPGMTEAFEKTVLEWAQRMSVPTPSLDVYQLEDPLPPLVQRVAARGCHVVVYTGPGGPAVGWVLASLHLMP